MNAQRYLGIKKNARMISSVLDDLGVSHRHRREFMENLHGYTRGEMPSDYVVKDADGFLVAQSSSFIVKLQDEIRDRRVRNRIFIEETMRTRYHNSAYAYFSTDIRNAFPSLFRYTIDVVPRPLSEFKGNEFNGTTIKIPLHWHRSVRAEGIAKVQAGDGPRIILSAKRYNLNWLSDEGVEAYRVRAFRYKNREGSVENAFVMKYSPDNLEWVTALSTNFKRCKSLLNRRINDKVERSLGII